MLVTATSPSEKRQQEQICRLCFQMQHHPDSRTAAVKKQQWEYSTVVVSSPYPTISTVRSKSTSNRIHFQPAALQSRHFPKQEWPCRLLPTHDSRAATAPTALAVGDEGDCARTLHAECKVTFKECQMQSAENIWAHGPSARRRGRRGGIGKAWRWMREHCSAVGTNILFSLSNDARPFQIAKL